MKKLPKIYQPLFEIDIPSLGKKMMFRPFLVKEEKILLVAQTEGTEKAIYLGICQVITNTCIDKIDVSKLTVYDVEYIFAKLRARSVDNVIKFKYTDPTDNETYDLEYDLNDLKVQEPEEAPSTIFVDKEAGIGYQLRLPSWEESIEFRNSGLSADATIDLMLMKCIDTVFDKEDIYQFSEYSEEERLEFINGLPVKTLTESDAFFQSIPMIEASVSFKKKDGTESEITLMGMNDFFSWG